MRNIQPHGVDTDNARAIWWRFLLLTLPVAGLVILSSYLFLHSEEQTHLNAVRMETMHHIESQAKNIAEEVRRAALHVQFLAKHGEILETLNGAPEALADMRDSFRSFAKYMGVYDQVRLLDDHGREVVRVDFRHGEAHFVAAGQLQDKSNSPYFQQSMQMGSGQVFVSKFGLNIEQGTVERPFKPVIRYATPVLDEHGNRRGVVVLNFLGKVLIRRYLDATDVLGENMLLSANSFFIHAADERSTWGSVLEEREDQSMADRFPEVWNAIVDEQDGQMLTDAGLFTFATISPFALLNQEEPLQAGAGDWIIVSYVPTDDLYADSMLSSRYYTYAIMLLFALWAVLAWLWTRSETRRQQAYLNLQQANHQKHRLLRRQMFVQEEERHVLARALHDDMGQSLVSIQAYAASIAKLSGPQDAEKSVQHAHHIRDITRHIQQAVRSHLRDLRPASLDRLGLCAALQTMLDEFAQRQAMQCEIDCAGESLCLNEQQNINLYRIVQEALTNIAKHAGASRVAVSLKLADGYLHLHIIDNGSGMGSIEESGLGLLGMRERTKLLHGQISIQSEPEKGVQIHITIPVQVSA